MPDIQFAQGDGENPLFEIESLQPLLREEEKYVSSHDQNRI